MVNVNQCDRKGTWFKSNSYNAHKDLKCSEIKPKSLKGYFSKSGHYMYLIIDITVWQWWAEGLILVCTYYIWSPNHGALHNKDDSVKLWQVLWEQVISSSGRPGKWHKVTKTSLQTLVLTHGGHFRWQYGKDILSRFWLEWYKPVRRL